MDRQELLALEQKVIAQSFKSNPATYEEAVEESLRYKLKWRDIEACANIHPELERDAIVLIANILGYKPPEYQRLPHEPSIRILIHKYRNGQIEPTQLFAKAAKHVRVMRNKEMERHSSVYGEAMQNKYDCYLVEYKLKARERLTKYLGYAPPLQTSIEAEILLRLAFADDTFHLPDKMVNTDLQVINIVKNREVLLEHGKEAADNSKLVAPDIYKQQGIL